MNDVPIELQLAYQFALKQDDVSRAPWGILARGLRDERAGRLELEWKANNHCITAEKVRDGVKAYRTNYDDNDPRHKWQFSDWQSLANDQLLGIEK